ncbi:MAG: nucleotidyltransferase family protein [Mesotoga sp.]|nr:nucleotidyltransferase family protein [Mesotoga sp.]HON27981.1 nucleotidyltransferase family protein [Mesotoga infera]
MVKSEKSENVALILLAAGTSSRFKSEKLTAFLKGKRLLQWAIDSLGPLELEKILVVKPGFPLGLFSTDGFRVVVNYDYRTGIASSVKAGLKSIDPRSEGLVLTLGDMPYIERRDVERLLAEAPRGREMTAFAFQGAKGFPTFVPRELFPELSKIEGDRGAFVLVKEGIANFRSIRGEKRHTVDIDLPEDIEGKS